MEMHYNVVIEGDCKIPRAIIKKALGSKHWQSISHSEQKLYCYTLQTCTKVCVDTVRVTNSETKQWWRCQGMHSLMSGSNRFCRNVPYPVWLTPRKGTFWFALKKEPFQIKYLPAKKSLILSYTDSHVPVLFISSTPWLTLCSCRTF